MSKVEMMFQEPFGNSSGDKLENIKKYIILDFAIWKPLLKKILTFETLDLVP